MDTALRVNTCTVRIDSGRLAWWPNSHRPRRWVHNSDTPLPHHLKGVLRNSQSAPSACLTCVRSFLDCGTGQMRKRLRTCYCALRRKTVVLQLLVEPRPCVRLRAIGSLCDTPCAVVLSAGLARFGRQPQPTKPHTLCGVWHCFPFASATPVSDTTEVLDPLACVRHLPLG